MLAIPAVIAQLINAMYSVVDRMFLGRMEEGGTLALSAIGISFPIIMLISAFAALIGAGGAPLASIKIGEGEHKKAGELLGSCCTMLLNESVILTALFLIFKSPFLTLFGASHDTLPLANDFLSIYLIGTVAVLISLGLNPFIAAQGYAKTVLRKIILLIPLVLLLPTFISPKTDAVIIAEPIADFCAALTCCVLFGLTIKRLFKDRSDKAGML